MRVWICAFFVLSLSTSLGHANEERPNIIFILADDLGWTDLGCFGSKYYQTPNLDKLAREGMRFTSAYTAGPNCAPTRACLMSGLYGPRHGIYTVGTGARGKAKHRQMQPADHNTTLPTIFISLARVLRDAGYVTAHFGKWHLGGPGKAGPKEHGFDYNYGGNKSGSPRGGYFSPYNNPQLPDGPKGENLTDRLSQEACQFIEKHQKQKFFMYMAYYAVHTPIQAKEDLTKKYQERKVTKVHNNPKYAAMVETLDTGIGKVLATLEKLKLTEKTLVIFTSDNGGVGGYALAGIQGGLEITAQLPLRGGKGMLYEGGVRVPMIVRWPSVVPPGSQCDVPVITVDFFPTLAAIGQAKTPSKLDGENLLPLFRDPKTKLKRDALYWHFPCYLEANVNKGTWRTTPAGSIRKGDWKLIEFFENGKVELYNLSKDIGQKNDLSEKFPEVCRDLHNQLKNWRKQTKAAMPTPKKASQPRKTKRKSLPMEDFVAPMASRYLHRQCSGTNLYPIQSRCTYTKPLDSAELCHCQECC